MEVKEKRELPPISYLRESVRVSASTLFSIIGACFSVYFFFQDNWVLHKDFEEYKIVEKKNNCEIQKNILKREARYLKLKKEVYPETFSKVEQFMLEDTQDQFNQIDKTCTIDQLKPK